MLSPAAQFCFLVVDNDTKNWIESRDECQRRGLTLVVPDTPLKMNILLKTIGTTPGETKRILGEVTRYQFNISLDSINSNV